MLLFYYAFAFFGTLIFLIYNDLKKRKQKENDDIIYYDAKLPEVPPVIQDKLNAFDSIVETNTKMLYMMDYQYQKETDYLKKQKILTKQADLQLKIANASEKADKLRNKYNLI